MIDSCDISDAAIQCIDEQRMRTLLLGVSAAAATDEVRNAFSIVYEDLGPVRLAGDFIFRTLAKEAEKAERKAEQLADAGAPELAASLARARAAFDQLDVDADGDVDMDDLRNASPAVLELLREEGDGPGTADLIDRLVGEDDDRRTGSLSFVEFALAAASTAAKYRDLTLADETDESISKLVSKFPVPFPAAGGSERLSKRDKMDARFDEMLLECAEWEAVVCGEAPTEECELGEDGGASADSRLELVLRGCFRGAKLPPVVAALKLVYVDYAPLRFGGDLIYKLMNKVVNSKR